MIAFFARLAGGIKGWGVAIAGFVAFAGAFIIAYLRKRLEHEKEENEQLKSELEWQDDLRTIEVQNEAKSKERREQSKKEMADGKVPSIFKRHT